MKNSNRQFMLLSFMFIIAEFSSAQWVMSNGPYKNDTLLSVFSFAKTRDNLFVGTSDLGVFVSSDDGEHWTAVNEGLKNTMILSLIIKDSILFAGSWEKGIFRSTNNGNLWVSVNEGTKYPPNPINGDYGDSTIWTFAIMNNYLFAGTGGWGIFRSSNNGDTWDDASTGLLLWQKSISSMTSKDTFIFASTGTGVLRSNDRGITWKYLNSGLNASVNQLAVIGNNLFAGTQESGVYISNDNGEHWIAANKGIEKEFVTSFAVWGTTIFAGTRRSIYRSVNYGADWLDVSDGLGVKYVRALFIKDKKLFAGTLDNGVWRRDLSEMMISVGDVPSVMPERFELCQNYPNPFNPSTRIEFSLPKSAYTTLKIYDLLGREIQILVEENMDAGSHLLEWNASNVTSGIYFYQLQSGNMSKVKKLLLLK